jgi:hypothetical protein
MSEPHGGRPMTLHEIMDAEDAAPAAPAGEPVDWRAMRDAEGIKNLRDHLDALTSIWEDRSRPKGERHYQDGAMDLQAGYARQWLGSIEAEWVAQRIATLSAPAGEQTAGAQPNAGPLTLRQIITELASGAQIVAHDDGRYELCHPGKPVDSHTLQWVLARDGWIESTPNCGAYVLTEAGRLAYLKSMDELGSGELVAPAAALSKGKA